MNGKKGSNTRAVVVAQLAERSLPIPEDPGSISSQLLLNIYLLLTVCRKDENKEKEGGNGPFFNKNIVLQLIIPILLLKKSKPLR